MTHVHDRFPANDHSLEMKMLAWFVSIQTGRMAKVVQARGGWYFSSKTRLIISVIELYASDRVHT